MACTNTVSRSSCATPGRDSKTTCCPDCGAVECLCRPRFFAGQLLSEQDLNRLDQYIKNKNRLHVRNLNGWGVVNGLQVLCDACGDVKVTEGYAVDPCGDDIVVCQETRVNICDLIRKCKQQQKSPQCDPVIRPGTTTHCDDLEEVWVLAINYQEYASRGVTALRGSACQTGQCGESSKGNCSCGGQCGGGSSCSCGTKSKTMAAGTRGATAKTQRNAPPACEPTVICEGFSFEVYKKPQENPDRQDDRFVKIDSDFWDRVNCCAKALFATVPPMPETTSTIGGQSTYSPSQASAWCCLWKKNLLDYFLSHPNTSCEAIDFIRAINCPPSNNTDGYGQEFTIAYLSLLAAMLEGLKVCICLALLPPTPEPSCDTRVPLATVRIRSRDCKILSVCNWTTERKIMVTWPAVGHWLGILSVGQLLHRLIDRVCCGSLLNLFENYTGDPVDDNQMTGMVAFNRSRATSSEISSETSAEISSQPQFSFNHVMKNFSTDLSARLNLGDIKRKSENFAQFVGAAFARGKEPLNFGAVLNNLSPRFKIPIDKNDELDEVEARHIPLLLLSELVVKPVAANLFGQEGMLQADELQHTLFSKKSTATDTSAEVAKTADMQRQIDQLQAQVKAHNEQLAVFIAQVSRKK